MNRFSIGAAAGLLAMSLSGAFAQSMMTGENDMTLYSYDKDTDGASTCYDECATNWPNLGQEGDELSEGWTLVDRTDGTKQRAYDGKPAYYYIEDKKAGDATGDGKGGVWHLLK